MAAPGIRATDAVLAAWRAVERVDEALRARASTTDTERRELLLSSADDSALDARAACERLVSAVRRIRRDEAKAARSAV